MIETPLVGRYANEGRRLVVAPPIGYTLLVRIVCVGGLGMLLLGGIVGPAIGLELPFYPEWWRWTGVGILFAGTLAALSMNAVVFDVKGSAYVRRQGPGFAKRVTRGGFDRLDAVVLLAEPSGRGAPGTVTYHLVLHWKGRAEPFLVMGSDTRFVHPGYPLESGAGPLREVGRRYAESLGVTFYDNAHFPSPTPVAGWR